jgi:hypothetical protein
VQDADARTRLCVPIEGDVIRAPYAVRNPDKLRHLATASASHDRGRG